MSKTFRPWKIEVADFVAEGHLAPFVVSLVREAVDLTEITGSYGSERGQPPFAPLMMMALLLYCYCCGLYSSRRIAKACRERVDFMSIVGLDAPDFRTIVAQDPTQPSRRHDSAFCRTTVTGSGHGHRVGITAGARQGTVL